MIALLAQSAAPALPPPERAAPTTGELADFLATDLPPHYQRLLYDYWKGRLDARGNPTGRTRKRQEAPAPEREEPALDPARPLAAASARLREAEQDRSRAVELDLSQVPDPEPTAAELRAAGRRAPQEHDHRDREHRLSCRRRRRVWRSDGADPT